MQIPRPLHCVRREGKWKILLGSRSNFGVSPSSVPPAGWQAEVIQHKPNDIDTMKLIALFALAASLFLTGCGGGSESAPAAPAAPAAPSTNAPAAK